MGCLPPRWLWGVCFGAVIGVFDGVVGLSLWCVVFVLVSMLWERARCDGVGVACERPRCGWLVWVRVLSLRLVVGGGLG